MKYFISAFLLVVIFRSYCQVIPIETFTLQMGKQISNIDDFFTENYKAELDQIDESSRVFSWKKGFNGDHLRNNQYIIYKITDSTFEFWYSFPTNLYYGQNNLKTYYGYYENELNDSKYKKLDDSIEEIGGYKAIVRNFQFGKYSIRIYKLASTNGTMIKVIKQL